jgi:hypothetical protein
MGFTRLPLWRATYVAMSEAVFHGWDARVGRDPGAAIPTPWALQVARGAQWFAPLVAHHIGAQKAPGRYRIDVGDGVGPVSVVVQGGNVSLVPGGDGNVDVSLALTADQYVRLIAGRFDPAAAVARGELHVEGEAERVPALKQIFRGIANGD